MIIGVPRERKPDERRVAITPDGVRELSSRGHTILIETNAGVLSGFTDAEFKSAGAEIAKTLEDVWGRADLLVKVKEPAPEEIKLFRDGLAVFSFLHLAVAPQLTKAMVDAGVTGIDYDLVMFDDGRLPILEPMSIIAGKLSIQCGAFSLQASTGGRGILLGGSIGVRPGKVVVIGAGAAGSNAARVATGMGAEVSILDINITKLQPFTDGHNRARTVYSSLSSIEREIADADLVIGSVLIPGALAPKLIRKDMLNIMQKGAVIVDICIDQGGCAESSRPTTISEPTYVDNGIVHYCVTNMPALVPRTSTIALTNATLGWIKMLADRGIEDTMRQSLPMRRSLTSYRKQLTNTVIGDAVGLKAASPAQVNELLGVR